MENHFETLQQKAATEWKALNHSITPVIYIGSATCGRSAGALETWYALGQFREKEGLDFTLVEVGCNGMCYAEPLMYVVKPGSPGIIYSQVTPERAEKIVKEYVMGNNPLAQYAIGTFGDGTIDGIPPLTDVPFFREQVRRVTRRCGFIDPANLHHYIAHEGYQGLQKALSLTPEAIIEEIKQSGLRGRGGAGFPTWRKWQFCRDAKSKQKYLVCNADEGDPGAYMNRSLIESDPHALLEGMAIAAYALGASRGYIYCRSEYPPALARLKAAIIQAEEHQLLGEHIFGTTFSFSLKVKEGAGAFVCGEETALLASIEGKRGMPRPRPPFPAISGLWGKPTVINNVETLAYVSHIFQHSAKWFTEYGTEKSKGTKTFALVGKVKNSGLVEVPLGISLREIIYNLGGGILNDHEFKAVQTGGPSGGCVPKTLLDTPIDYDSLSQVGTIMGSGGIVIMDDHDCMVDIARYFLDFTQNESCGKCVPCRLGTKQMLMILNRITAGEGCPADIDLLEELCATIKKGSLCGLGQTAPNPALTSLRYFKHEYEAHIHDKKCPAKVCKNLKHFRINKDKCIGCQQCIKACPTKAIIGEKKMPHEIIQANCVKCGICIDTCSTKIQAIERVAGAHQNAEGESHA